MKRKDLIENIKCLLECDEFTVKLYLLLLEKPRTKIEIENEITNCDERIEFLLSKSLINVYTDERSGGDTLYFSIDPKYSLSALLLNEVWKIDSNVHSLDLLENRNDLPDLRKKYLILNEVSIAIQTIYNRQLPYVKEIVVIMKGTQKIAGFIAEQISEAQKNIVAIVSPPQLMGEIVWQALENRMSCGVCYKRITDFDEIIRHGFEIACHELKSYNEDMYIYTNGTLVEKFYVLDEHRVIFFEKNKTRQEFISQIQYIRNFGVAKQFINRYTEILNRCIDFKKLIPLIKEYREKFINKAKGDGLGSDIVEWLVDLFDNGVFYSTNKYNKIFISRAIEMCNNKGLIRMLPDGHPVVNYGLNDLSTN